MALVNPTAAAHEWNTQNTLAIRKLYDQLIDPHQDAMPTLRLLLSAMKRDTLGPDMKIGYPIITKHVSPSMGEKRMRFEAQDVDNITQQEWTPAMQATSVGTNDVDWAHYKTPEARMNHINVKVGSMHAGYTDMMNWALWSDWNEDISSGEIDITGALSSHPRPPEGLSLKNVSAHTSRMLSIPMIIRTASATGHTVGGITVTTGQNSYWNPIETSPAAATITRSTNAWNYDAVTAVANPQVITLDDIADHLNKVLIGYSYKLYCAVPAAIYNQLRNMILAITQRDIGNPLADLGIRGAIEWSELNVVFYLEPMCTWLWPNSLWFFDLENMFLFSDQDFDPTMQTGIYEWEHIPGTNMNATAMFHIVQLLGANRAALSVMHGYKAS